MKGFKHTKVHLFMYYVCKSYENLNFHLVDDVKPTWELDVKVVDILTFNDVHVVQDFRVSRIGYWWSLGSSTVRLPFPKEFATLFFGEIHLMAFSCK